MKGGCRRMGSARRVAGIVVAAALGAGWGCGVDASGRVALREPERSSFDAEAGPLLAKRCGDMSCHGDGERAFPLYATGRRRVDATKTFSSEPLTVAEVDANYRATLGFLDAPRGRDTTLLRKALGVGGDGGHKAIFAAPSDPECRAVAAWIDGVER